VDNVVTWRCLEENVKLKLKGSDQYKKLMRETMISLLTRPSDDYAGNDVIQCAIKYGAYAVLHEILNTKDVFRFHVKDVFVLGKCTTNYDVTNFTLATRANVTVPVSTRSIDSSRDYTQQKSFPYLLYLRELALSADKWSDKNILEEQPMRALTTPYFRVVQTCYLILGLLQLIYMICFSHYHVPNTCSLVQLFNLKASGSNCSSGNSSDWNPGVSRDSYLSLWLIWPVILCAGNACSCVVDMIWYVVARFHKYSGNSDDAERLPTKLLLAIGQMFPALSFCVSIFVWYSRYDSGTMLLSYLEATSMVFLFGWTTNLVFFSGITRQFYVFTIVLMKIFKDIFGSFLPVFVFTLLGFSFAMHILNLYNLPADDEVYLVDTVYDVLAASLGSSDYVKDTRKERLVAGIHLELFEVVVIGYICMSALILLNVLIAMMNHRYDKAKQRANNFWRFQMLRIALDLECVPGFQRLFIWLLRLKRPKQLCDCCGVCCCYCSHAWLETVRSRKLLTVERDFID